MSSEDEGREVKPIGWDAIDKALAPIYGDREPVHYGTIIPMMLGGKDPLTGISVYKNLTPKPHYHFVTFGYSELYEKETEDPEYSGYGFEMTFRLACAPNSPNEPPNWPLSFLQNLARYVFSSGNAFDERHHCPFNGPIALEEETDITAGFFMLDPQLQSIQTPNGLVKFLQLVGLSTDEYELIKEGYFDAVADRVADLEPLGITEIYRPSILEDTSVLEEITSQEPTASQGEVFGTLAEWTEADGQLEIRVGATIVPQLKSMLKSRVAQGIPAVVYGKGFGIVFEPGEKGAWEVDEQLLYVTIPAGIVQSLVDSLQPTQGIYPVSETPEIKLKIVPIEIKDRDGKVIKTVG